jgi:hypothetical protein
MAQVAMGFFVGERHKACMEYALFCTSGFCGLGSKGDFSPVHTP